MVVVPSLMKALAVTVKLSLGAICVSLGVTSTWGVATVTATVVVEPPQATEKVLVPAVAALSRHVHTAVLLPTVTPWQLAIGDELMLNEQVPAKPAGSLEVTVSVTGSPPTCTGAAADAVHSGTRRTHQN
jgi:hypothetical protein